MCSIVRSLLSHLLAFDLISCCIALNSQSHCSYKPPHSYAASLPCSIQHLEVVFVVNWYYINEHI